jgi:hypothetical protein
LKVPNGVTCVVLEPRKDVARVLLEFVQRLGVRLAEKERLIDALTRAQATGISSG